MAGGALWGAIAGLLKAKTGAHEVITTIMLNTVATSTLLYLQAKDAFQRPGSGNPLSLPLPKLPALFPSVAGTPASSSRSWPPSASGGCSSASTLGFEMRGGRQPRRRPARPA